MSEGWWGDWFGREILGYGGLSKWGEEVSVGSVV